MRAIASPIRDNLRDLQWIWDLRMSGGARALISQREPIMRSQGVPGVGRACTASASFFTIFRWRWASQISTLTFHLHVFGILCYKALSHVTNRRVEPCLLHPSPVRRGWSRRYDWRKQSPSSRLLFQASRRQNFEPVGRKRRSRLRISAMSCDWQLRLIGPRVGREDVASVPAWQMCCKPCNSLRPSAT